MRVITAVDMRATARTGSRDSAAATTVISAPTIAKNTLVTAASTATTPSGAKPPPLTRLLQVGSPCEVRPKAQAAATTINATIAETLMSENQNSNSP